MTKLQAKKSEKVLSPRLKKYKQLVKANASAKELETYWDKHIAKNVKFLKGSPDDAISFIECEETNLKFRVYFNN